MANDFAIAVGIITVFLARSNAQLLFVDLFKIKSVPNSTLPPTECRIDFQMLGPNYLEASVNVDAVWAAKLHKLSYDNFTYQSVWPGWNYIHKYEILTKDVRAKFGVTSAGDNRKNDSTLFMPLLKSDGFEGDNWYLLCLRHVNVRCGSYCTHYTPGDCDNSKSWGRMDLESRTVESANSNSQQEYEFTTKPVNLRGTDSTFPMRNLTVQAYVYTNEIGNSSCVDIWRQEIYNGHNLTQQALPAECRVMDPSNILPMSDKPGYFKFISNKNSTSNLLVIVNYAFDANDKVKYEIENVLNSKVTIPSYSMSQLYAIKLPRSATWIKSSVMLNNTPSTAFGINRHLINQSKVKETCQFMDALEKTVSTSASTKSVTGGFSEILVGFTQTPSGRSSRGVMTSCSRCSVALLTALLCTFSIQKR